MALDNFIQLQQRGVMQISDIDRRKIGVAFDKWIDREPMSAEDFERIMYIFQNNDLALSSTDPARAAALQVRLRAIIQEKYTAKG